MDRTKEFFKMVQLTENPQNNVQTVNNYTNLHQTHKYIEELFKNLDKITSYDKFKIQPIIEDIERSLDAYKQFTFDALQTKVNDKTHISINEIVQMRILKFRIKLKRVTNKMKNENKSNTNKDNSIKSVYKQEHQYDQNINPQHNNQNNSQYFIQEEQQKQNYVNTEKYEQRKRIVNRISEMGEIVENISLHVSLQEMELRRIDDTIGKSENYGRRAYDDLLDTWNMVSEKRKTMIKFLLFWIFLLITFYICKKK